MTRVDFYQLGRDPVDITVARLAHKVMQAGERLVVVSADAAQRTLLSQVLWAQDGASFLVHGTAGAAHDARQPILIAADAQAPNGAGVAIIADGQWRDEAAQFSRVLLLFDAAARDAAAQLWRRFAADPVVDNRIFKQDERGGWREGA